MEPAGMDEGQLVASAAASLDRQLYRNASTLAREALCTSKAPPRSATRSIIPERPKELRLSNASSLNPKTDSIIFYAKFNGMIGGSQANVYSGR